jgi:hypothetical protein
VLIIGLGHRARQGKNTAGLAMLDALPIGVDARLYAFADDLKQEFRTACAKFGCQYNLIEAFKEMGLMPEWVKCEEPKPRTGLQWWGTWKRSKHPRYWIDRLDRKLVQHAPEVAVITDVRNVNEVEYIHERGGYVVDVVRVGKTDVPVHEHESESALDDYNGWDATIEAATVDECKAQAVMWLRIFRGLAAGTIQEK